MPSSSTLNAWRLRAMDTGICHPAGSQSENVTTTTTSGRPSLAEVSANAGEEVQNLLVGGLRGVGHVSVTGVWEDHEPGSSDAVGESLSVGGGDDAVQGSVHDQRRDADLS